MSTIDDIINAATPGEWRATGRVVTWAMDKTDDPELVCECVDEEDARFIAAFDPEHIRLMEDERRLARTLFADGKGDNKTLDAYYAACDATDAYRKERGLA